MARTRAAAPRGAVHLVVRSDAARRELEPPRDSPEPDRPMATAPPEPKPATDTEAPDPLAALHKMSTTAGVASQQYVAVNGAAVLAALLGFASALTILSPVLLVVPAAG